MVRASTATTGRTRGSAKARAASARVLRADARRNRARVLDVAIAAFAAEGLAVPIHEIARRAGVGTGTVSRHFPTKEALYEAIVHDRVGRLVEQARALKATKDPGQAFFAFFSTMANEFAANLGLADALAGAGFDVEAAASSSKDDVIGAMRQLLASAQKAGAVRKDIEPGEVKALMIACCRGPQSADAEARRRMIAVVCQGLRPGSKSQRLKGITGEVRPPLARSKDGRPVVGEKRPADLVID